MMTAELLNYYRCPAFTAHFQLSGHLSATPGYFRWGEDTVCYGRCSSALPSRRAEAELPDCAGAVTIEGTAVQLPFDAAEVIENLLRERYSAHFREEASVANEVIRKIYYLLRPYLSVPVRKRLQKLHLRNWDKINFPAWPIDTTVDRIQRKMLALAMRAEGVSTLPFIWFWPDAHHNCAILTHDVEDIEGRDFCGRTMDIDESFGFRSSFQVVPEDRYSVPDSYLASIANRGFEVNVHDLKHDGRLYAEHGEFLRRAARINDYARQFGACGFRSGVLYRNADWYQALNFLYDMSIPNVAHLDPQRGGCCTVMPYFIGNIVELPLTCTQDYTLFHILGDYSIEVWKRQIQLIREAHGLITILVHPDYIREPRAQAVYKQLLAWVAKLRDRENLWTPLPRQAAEWWRQRSAMRLIESHDGWHIEGQGRERATVAYACVTDDSVTYRLAGTPVAAGG